MLCSTARLAQLGVRVLLVLANEIDWEHHFDDNSPAYQQVSRDGLLLHLSEHHGDGCPGSTVFVSMTGIEEFHREITSKNDKYLRPGLETTFYDAKYVQVTDPFGNRIRFNEDRKPGEPYERAREWVNCVHKNDSRITLSASWLRLPDSLVTIIRPGKNRSYHAFFVSQ